jgi:hypothetical protein
MQGPNSSFKTNNTPQIVLNQSVSPYQVPDIKKNQLNENGDISIIN